MSSVPAPPVGRPTPNASQATLPLSEKTAPPIVRGNDAGFFLVPDDIISVLSGKTDEMARQAMARCRHSCEAVEPGFTPRTTEQIQKCMGYCYRGEQHVQDVKKTSKLMFGISTVTSAVVFGGLYRKKKRWPQAAFAGLLAGFLVVPGVLTLAQNPLYTDILE